MQVDTHEVALRHRPRRWTWWLIPSPFTLISSAFYLSVFGAFLLDYRMGQYQQCGCQDGSLRLLVMVAAITSLLVIDRLENWLYGEETPMRIAVVFFVTRVLIYEVIAADDYSRYSPVLAILLTLLAYWYFGSLVGYEIAVLACVDFAIHQVVTNPGWLSDPQYAILFFIGLVFSLALVRALVRERDSRARSQHLLTQLEEAHHQLEGAHQQLRLYAEQVEELATTKERNRLARDIHDSLGHYLTIINVQLEKAILFRDRDQTEANQAVQAAKRLSSEALQDVRHSVSTLRAMEDMLAFTPAMTEVVERLRSSQLSIDLQISGSEEGYSKRVLLTLFRAAQEGLTNIQKHATASSAQLKIEFGESVATLRLVDNGRGFLPATLAGLQPGRKGSYGLQGVRERLELVGGTLGISSSQAGGTALSITVPKDAPLRTEPLYVQAPQEVNHERAATDTRSESSRVGGR